VRSTYVLMGAWHAIRRNAETSQLRTTKDKAKEFGLKLPSNIKRLQGRLIHGYSFEKAHGATPSKGKGKTGKRPLVVASLEDRIVQRAILDVLQNSPDLPTIRAVLDTPTSIGGVPGRGVDWAINLIDSAWQDGYRFASGSDIKGFFTKISKPQVLSFLSNEISDHAFMDLVERALTVELKNSHQLSTEDLLMFPLGDDGVAQGSPLSALAGNIVLHDFDQAMNQRGLICIRYIDDFIILGKKPDNVQKGMDAARRLLRDLGMDVYDPDSRRDKAFAGPIDGTQVFLGYCLNPPSYPPSKDAQEKFKATINRLINEGQAAIHKALEGRTLKPSDRTFAATVVAINNAARGWKGAFRCSRCSATFNSLDHWVQTRVRDFEQHFVRKTQGCDRKYRAMALGVMPLEGTPH
jgi:retron-type reverse transcriptase